MQAGTQMAKLKGKKKGLIRFFYLDEHKSCIRWRPSRKNDKAKITIDSIHEIIEGKKSEIFRRYADNRFDPNCCFSIYYGERVKSLDLVSTNADEARTWVTGLKYLMAGISDEDSLARRQRTQADKNGDGTLSIGEVHQLLHKLNVNLPKEKVRQMFEDADTDENQGSLGFEEFCSFYKMISTRRDLYLIMISYSNQKEVMDLHDLTRFLENEQKIRGLAREHLAEIVAKFEPCPENLQHMVLGIDGFTNFMRSPAGDIFNPEHNQVNQDMTQPLNNYFIATSHNTYLTGDQLLSQSRVEMYAYVLQAGLPLCGGLLFLLSPLLVDCWDGPDGEPIIHHGYTLTSKILFKDVVETINKYAFTKSEYPVILSIENHCTVPQQKKMAEYLKEVLQDKLDLSSVNVHECRKLPSPEILKGKVLVKGKKLPANIDPGAEEGDVSDEDTGDEDEEEDDDDDDDIAQANETTGWTQCYLCQPSQKEEAIWQIDHKELQAKGRGKTMRLSRALSDLVKVHKICPSARHRNTSWQVSSLNETVMNQILQLKPGQLVRFNQRQLVRVYPSNYRVDSSNFNPQPYWNAGCHMVAMNYQTEGRMLELNQAKFSTNGNCGYILKPKCMSKAAFNPMLEDPLSGQRKTQLVMKIISGQQLPKPKDFYVWGQRRGFNPMWEETLVFNIKMPQIALVRFQVWDHDPIGQGFIGQRTVAFTSMMPGYRHVYLEGMAESSIFVHVAIIDATGKSKPSNAVQAARKHIQKAAQKHMMGHQKQPSQDSSVLSSEDGRAPHFRKDLDAISQDSRNWEMSPLVQGPAAKAAIHKGAMSEPVKRAHKVKIHDPPETRRGIFSRMSSTDSHHMGPAPYVKAESFDLETLPQNPFGSDRHNSIQEELENEPDDLTGSNCAEQEIVQTFDPEQPEQSEELPKEPQPDKDITTEPEQPPETQSQTDSLPQPQPVPHPLPQPEAKSSPLIPPSSPARVRRTLEAPATPRLSTPIWIKARSRSCPRKHTASPQTPMVRRQQAQNYSSCGSQVKPIPNGLCLSDSTSSSSDDSLEFVPSSVTTGAEQREGTLQREMKALFDQRMREIRCKSPLFLND
ncbi:1-phosphatidylinositol 4,5-bisphosphate phosphodiesterase eta-2 [Collichthys lucidus]|uniref:Phosphoinositide phospholipase C n=1 Tax=Collichthys lucidus TaxID=240159 RepID=A0A4U5UAE5_COLLU|nr:1-phosphatidylinositol 4,5-bisphosphate phosphodiesterase eta-2 [Collichthys lucidus]